MLQMLEPYLRSKDSISHTIPTTTDYDEVKSVDCSACVFGWGRLNPIQLCTEAGCTVAGLAIFDTSGACASLFIRCNGHSDGIGSLLLAIGTPSKRSAASCSNLDFAPEARSTGGTANEIETAAREVFGNDMLYELCSSQWTAVERIAEDSDDGHQSTTEAQAYGLIDHILQAKRE